MAQKNYTGRTEIEKTFLKTFGELCTRHNAWTVWQTFVNTAACAISNSVDRREDVWRKREDSYLASIKEFTKEEAQKLPALLGLTTMALEENPAQDFLGTLYMNLDFGSGWSGQFFTPYHVSEFMALVAMGNDFEAQIEREGMASVSDPCCGAGSMLIAFAQACRARNINYQRDVLFTAQDIDRVVAQMCYIQLSLLGCAGYVVVGDSLTLPMTENVLTPAVNPECEIWMTPMLFSEPWRLRHMASQMQEMSNQSDETAQQNQP